MRRKKTLGKRGGLASTLVDIYSIFFYVFVLLLFIIIFSLAKGFCILPSSCHAQEIGITSEESDKTLEARMLLLSLLKGPVVLPDGRTMDIAEIIALNELASEDLEEELEAALTETIEGYFAEAFEEYEDSFRYIHQSWEIKVTYRSDSSFTVGELRVVSPHRGSPGIPDTPAFYCAKTAETSAEIPLVYNPAEESQKATIEFSVCSGLLGRQWGVD